MKKRSQLGIGSCGVEVASGRKDSGREGVVPDHRQGGLGTGVEGLLENLPRGPGAGAALRATTRCECEFAVRVDTAIHGINDGAIGYGVAKADIHA